MSAAINVMISLIVILFLIKKRQHKKNSSHFLLPIQVGLINNIDKLSLYVQLNYQISTNNRAALRSSMPPVTKAESIRYFAVSVLISPLTNAVVLILESIPETETDSKPAVFNSTGSYSMFPFSKTKTTEYVFAAPQLTGTGTSLAFGMTLTLACAPVFEKAPTFRVIFP